MSPIPIPIPRQTLPPSLSFADNFPLPLQLVTENDPNLILFVGEALVGNDGVDQLVEFNNSLRKYQDTKKSPRLVDGIFLTKFDTIDDKVRLVNP